MKTAIILESDEAYIMERRPDGPDDIYPGRLQLLGGSFRFDERVVEAAHRELSHKTDLPVEELDIHLLWEGVFTDEEIPRGRRRNQYIGLVSVHVGSRAVHLTQGSELVKVPKAPEDLQHQIGNLTPLAQTAVLMAQERR